MSDCALVTGSEGFVGKTLVRELQRRHTRVLRVSRTTGHDLRDPDALDAFQDASVQIVFHLAARSFVPDSWRDPASFYEVNVLGTQRVLDFCRHTGARLVHFSSYVYGVPAYLPVDEQHPVAPTNPYGHSKWLAEELCRFYGDKYLVPISIVRPFNIYGTGQSPEFLIAQLLQQWTHDRRIVVNDPLPRRDYLYVDDLVAAVLVVARLEEPFGVYNVGAGQSVSVRELIETLGRVVGEPVQWESRGTVRPHEIMDVVAGCRLRALGLWQPTIDLHDGLARCLEAIA
jgi:nucleoside-diphosphate-sugar epimerase